MSEGQVRSLTVDDLMAASEIIDSLVSNLSKEDLEMIMSGDKDAKQIGISVIKAAIKHARVPAFEFLASVNDITVEDFKKLPANSIPRTIKCIIENPENKDFFMELRSLLPGA